MVFQLTKSFVSVSIRPQLKLQIFESFAFQELRKVPSLAHECREEGRRPRLITERDIVA